MMTIRLKSILVLSALIMTGWCYGQKDINQLTVQQWQEDLDSLVAKGNEIFAGFTPESKKRFNQEAAKIRSAIAGMKGTSVALEFTRLLALLEDGHTEVSFRTPAFRGLPIRMYFFGKDLYITAASEAHRDLIGGVITHMDGLPVMEVFERVKPYINADNDVEYIFTAPEFLTVVDLLEEMGVSKDPREVMLTVRKENGLIVQQTIPKLTAFELRNSRFVSARSTIPLYLTDLNQWYWYKYLPDSDIMFVSIGFVSNQENRPSIAEFWEDMFKAIDEKHPAKLVIDFRNCRGGNYYRSLPLVEGIVARPELNKKGKIFIVHSRLTFSAPATTTLFLRDSTEALVIGETCRDRPNRSDNVEFYNLPNSGLRYGYSNRLRIHSPKLGNVDRIPVDIAIEPTFEGFKAGKDEVLEYIVKMK